MIPVYAENTRGRDFVIGDLHGCVDALYRKMGEKNFDPSVDRIFSTGDLVDRGPHSEMALGLTFNPWFISVMGNHEDAGIGFTEGRIKGLQWYAGIGGAWMIGKTQHERIECALTMLTMPLAVEIDIGEGRRVGIVHAQCPFESWDDFRRSQDPASKLDTREMRAVATEAMWARGRYERMDASEVKGIHAVIVGHTPVERVTSLGNTYYVDTGCFKTGKLAMKQIKKLVGA